MHYIAITTLLAITLFAQYEAGKIDMHGGKNDYTLKKSGFARQNIGVSNFLDANASKETKESKEAKVKN